MKKALSTFCFLAVMLVSMNSWAKPVSADQARRVAATFLKGIGCKQAENIADRSADLPFRNFYLFAAPEGGFALVSADDCVVPILGYSATNQFDSERLPAHVADWLGGYEEQIAYFVRLNQQRGSSSLRSRSADGAVLPETLWRMLLRGQMPPAVQNTTVTPLLTTTWNQSPLYNNLCPNDYSSQTVAGCTAIATAQVMKYWNQPATGYGSHSYYHNLYGTLSANFGSTTYQWSQMPNSLSSSSTQAQINAVATLVYHVGVAVEMDYGVDGSGARTVNFGDIATPSAENALKYYFKYKSTLHSINRADYTPAEFATILTTELTNSRPIIFTGYDVDAGHAFVLDGVNNSGDFHVNWGWGGYCDGYYTMGALNPTTGGTGGNTSGTYNIDNSAIIGIQPSTTFNPTSTTLVTATCNSSSMGSVTGGGYYNFGDTVALYANATSGNRFLNWNDNSRQNPRSFIATGGNYAFNAICGPLQGDTLGYATTDTWLTSFGGDNNAYWGIKLPASTLTPNHDLRQVQLFIAAGGNYTVSIYVGALSNTPATQSFTASNGEVGSWKTIPLYTPVPVNGNQDIWITFHTSGISYPAALTYDCGNADGMLWSSAYTSYQSTWHYTFMIRGIFEASSVTTGDTISYCGNDSFQTGIGAGGSLYWGIMMPSTMLTGRNALTAVKLYVKQAGTYQLRVSMGGTSAPQSPLITQTEHFTDADTDSWQTILLNTPLAINNTQPLWVTFYCDDAPYPATASAAISDFNGSWVSTDGSTWTSLYAASGSTLNYTWMIKCVTSPNQPALAVSIDGPSTLRNSTSQTFTASCNYPNATYSWNLPGASNVTGTGNTRTAQWNTAGTYNITVSATVNGTTVRDTLQLTVTNCDIATFPYLADFSNGDLGCWISIDNDNDGYGWDVTTFTGTPASASYINDIGPLTPDNWLVSPAIVLPQGATHTLSWLAKGVDQNYAAEHYSVYISTTGSSVANFTTQIYTGNTTANYTRQTYNLSAYAGQTVHIAFRHHNSSDMYWMVLDSIAIAPGSVPTYTITATANNPAYGTVTGGGNYNAGTSVTLVASAFSDCRFARWSDGSTANPRSVTVTANHTYTAVFEHLSGDTLRYDNGNFNDALGTGNAGDMFWASRFNGSATQGHDQLTKVSFYSANAGIYNIQVYQGGTSAPSTLACTQSCTTSVSNAWVTCQLSTPVQLTSTTPIWIVLSSPNLTYPAAMADNCGNPDGSWISLDGTSWSSLSSITQGGFDNTWMIRGIMGNSAPQQYIITATANNPAYGTVTGGGTYNAGTSVTLVATPNAGYEFVQWNDGNTQASRTITVTANATYTANFQPRASNSYTITATANNPAYGTVTGGGTYNAGTSVTLSAIPNTGYEFVQWNDGNTQASRTITVTADASYIANFQPRTFTVTITADDPAHGTVTGGGSYAYMASVTATATPLSGYVFAGWSNGESSNPYTFSVTEDTDLQARFLPETGIDPVGTDRWIVFADKRDIVVRHAGQHALRLYDMSGRLMASADQAGDEHRFTVSHSGIYFVVANDGTAKKVIVL